MTKNEELTQKIIEALAKKGYIMAGVGYQTILEVLEKNER